MILVHLATYNKLNKKKLKPSVHISHSEGTTKAKKLKSFIHKADTIAIKKEHWLMQFQHHE